VSTAGGTTTPPRGTYSGPAKPTTTPVGVVDVDAFSGDAECLQAVALGGEVLLIGGDAGVADVQAGHRRSMPYGPRSSRRVTEPVLRDSGGPAALGLQAVDVSVRVLLWC
jgi:hypothetical protein